MIEAVGQSFGKMFNTSSFTLTKFLWSSSKPASVLHGSEKTEVGIALKTNANGEVGETEEKNVQSNSEMHDDLKDGSFVISEKSKHIDSVKTGEQQAINEKDDVTSIQGTKGERWKKIQGRFSGPTANRENMSPEKWHKLEEVLNSSTWRQHRLQRLLARMRSDPEDVPLFKEFDFV